VNHIPASFVVLFLIHHREDRGHRERNVRRYMAPRWSLSVVFSVLSVPLWFLLRQTTPACAPEHGEKTVNGYVVRFRMGR